MNELDYIDNELSYEEKLPTGMQEFNKLVEDLKNFYGPNLPTQDETTLKFVIATTIMHLGPLDSHKSLEFFYKTIVAGAAKQVAHAVFRDIKLQQEAEALLAQQTPSDQTTTAT